ncbi:MAG: GNAT family protein [Clostridia bacterium]
MGRMYGKQVTLREYRWEDLGDIRAWVTNDKVCGMLGSVFYKPQTWEQTEQYLRGILDGNSGANFVIAQPDTLKYLGQCNLMMIDSIARKAEIGIVLLPESMGRGIAREALALLCRYAFHTLNLNRLYLKVYERNVRAVHLYEMAGFRHEGCLREDSYLDGCYEDTLVMGLLKSEWEKA